MLRRTALVAIALVLSGCASVGTYQPQSADRPDGYADRRLDDTHWRVEFVGDASTSQERVESYLLYRAAEITIDNGFDWFLPAEHALEEETEVIVEARAAPALSPVWRPMWRHRKRFFWSDWMPAGARREPESELPQSTAQTITRYAAREDITMGTGAPPQGAFNAREVVALLQPSIVRP